MIEHNKLSNNSLAVMALASEYCRALELAEAARPMQFVDKMTRLLPRIYMAVADIPAANPDEIDDYSFGANHLDEATYDRIRRIIETLLGEDDSYLETMLDDMKYSDTPIGATISEGLADIFQVLFNFVEDVRNADVETTYSLLASLRADFAGYWSQTLCNIMRPLNELARRHETDGDASDTDCRDYTDSDELDFI